MRRCASVAPPAVVVAEEGDEFLGGEVLEFWCRAEGFVFGFDAVDASEAVGRGRRVRG